MVPSSLGLHRICGKNVKGCTTMKRTLALLLALAMMLSALAGCAKEPAETPSGSGSTSGTTSGSTSGSGTTSGGTTTGGTTTTEPVKVEPYGTFRDYTTTEITNLYPGENGDSDASDILKGTLLKPYDQALNEEGKVGYISELMAEYPVPACTSYKL